MNPQQFEHPAIFFHHFLTTVPPKAQFLTFSTMRRVQQGVIVCKNLVQLTFAVTLSVIWLIEHFAFAALFPGTLRCRLLCKRITHL